MSLVTDPRFFTGVRAVFTDLDGTLTTDGRLGASTYESLEALGQAGVVVVIVTGRPAGWAQGFSRVFPVSAVIAENGGVLFMGAKKTYSVATKTLSAVRLRMHADAQRVILQVPGARLSADSPYTEVNLALDWNEDVHLPVEDAKRMEKLLRGLGYSAVRSSVHVNFWPGRFDKLSACRKLVKAWGHDPNDLSPYVYVGDSLNDEPMFRGFPRSIGVANVKSVWDELVHKPLHVTKRAEGRGFEEIAKAILAARKRSMS